jgi:hypothetical protein
MMKRALFVVVAAGGGVAESVQGNLSFTRSATPLPAGAALPRAAGTGMTGSDQPIPIHCAGHPRTHRAGAFTSA